MKSFNKLIIASIAAILFMLPGKSNAQLNGINYQAVAVDENGKEIAGMDIQGNILHNKAINVRFTILAGGTTGTVLYQEIHTTNTDPHGLFSLVIGRGTSTNAGTIDSINHINWSTQNHWLKVEIDTKGFNGYKLMGVQQLLAVPYAYYALNSGNAPQTLTLSDNQLTISGGNSITIPNTTYNAGSGISISGNTITNSDPNQFQILSITNDTIYLSNGGFVKIPAQNLSINSNQLTISNGNTVTIPTTNYDAGTGISIAGNTITNTAPNQIQVLSISNDTIYLSNGGFVKIPPATSVSWNNITNVPANIDTIINNNFTGNYTDLTNTPTNLSQFTNDVGFITDYTEIQALSISNDTI